MEEYQEFIYPIYVQSWIVGFSESWVSTNPLWHELTPSQLGVRPQVQIKIPVDVHSRDIQWLESLKNLLYLALTIAGGCRSQMIRNNSPNRDVENICYVNKADGTGVY